MSKKKASCSEGQDDIVTSLLGELNGKQRTAYSFYDREDPSEVKYWLSTGSTLLDYAISNRRNGGVPFGRIIEINGLESSGKSLLSLHIIANAQKQNGIGMILDTESRLLDKDFCVRFGVDPKRLVIDSPGTIEGCFESIEKAITNIRTRHKARDVPFVIVWDSLAATPPQAEIEGTYDPSSQIGIGAKAVARGLRKLTQTIGLESICLVIINQLRMKMNAMPFSDPYITPYGKSLAYFASTRLRVTQTSAIKTPDKQQIGVGCQVKTVKNSMGPPMRVAEFPIIYGYGVDDMQSIYDYLCDEGTIRKSAGKSVFTLNGERHEIPHDEWKAFMSQPKHNKAIHDFLETKLVKHYKDPAQDIESIAEPVTIVE